MLKKKEKSQDKRSVLKTAGRMAGAVILGTAASRIVSKGLSKGLNLSNRVGYNIGKKNPLFYKPKFMSYDDQFKIENLKRQNAVVASLLGGFTGGTIAKDYYSNNRLLGYNLNKKRKTRKDKGRKRK